MEMDVLDFNVFVSGRMSHGEAMERARISGDRVFVEKALKIFLSCFRGEPDMDVLLLQHGILLFLIGLLTGFVIHKFADPRMGLPVIWRD